MRIETAAMADRGLPALLEQLVGEVSGARLPSGEATTLFQRHRGDIRACLRELYDRWAG